MRTAEGNEMINRSEIAAELVENCPVEARADHQAIASAILRGEGGAQILAMRELDMWPETYVWLRGTLTV